MGSYKVNPENVGSWHTKKGNYYQHLNPERAFCWDVTRSENARAELGLGLLEKKTPDFNRERNLSDS